MTFQKSGGGGSAIEAAVKFLEQKQRVGRTTPPNPRGLGPVAEGVEATIEGVGGLRTWVMLRDVMLAADAASITFSAIPAQYRHIYVTGDLRSDRSAINDDVFIQINGDIGSSYYSNMAVTTHSATVTTTEKVAQTAMAIGNVPGDTAPTNTFGALELTFPDYANSTKNKQCFGTGFVLRTTSTGGSGIVTAGGLWAQTTVVSTIKIYPGAGSNWKSTSRLTLYGLSA